ncbi:helix-turn-helix transcriptional regulator [Streptacidiphilus cavernicola]|uniref:Helix-turn-helix transcriptional regulator n=1 Tax=Streptacidiphilus cavernicola TaxID=3342716 RepID=A0ABV6W041_9ACTN
MSPRDTELWSYTEIAAHIGVKAATVKSYRRHGVLPEPDVVTILGQPRWYASTIRAWTARRPHNRDR